MDTRPRVTVHAPARTAWMPRSRTWRTWIVFSIGLLASFPAFATMLLKKDFEDLVAESDGVVVGHVAAVESSRDENGEIFTFVTLDELDVVDGVFDGVEFVLRIEGGEVDGVPPRLLLAGDGNRKPLRTGPGPLDPPGRAVGLCLRGCVHLPLVLGFHLVQGTVL